MQRAACCRAESCRQGGSQFPSSAWFPAAPLSCSALKSRCAHARILSPRRRASREAILDAVAACLPAHVPLLPDAMQPPAVAMRRFVDAQIAKFQAKVSAHAAAHRAETRWFWQRQFEDVQQVVSSRESFGAWAYAMIPDTVAEAWGWFMAVMVGMFAVSCINALAQSQKAWMDQRAASGGEEAQGKKER